MAKSRREPAKEQVWRERVSAWRACGLRVREYCPQRQLGEANFDAWWRELQRQDSEPLSALWFVVRRKRGDRPEILYWDGGGFALRH